jgi:hypothetical protein
LTLRTRLGAQRLLRTACSGIFEAMFGYRIHPVAHGVMTVLFLISAGLQWNDPDPVQWTAIYTAAAVLSGRALLGKRTAPFDLVVACVALVWAATLVPNVVGRAEVADLIRRMDIMRPQVEEARELGGLLIVAGWLLAHGLSRAARANAAATGGAGLEATGDASRG